MAIHAATGARNSDAPSQKCDSAVKRFVSEGNDRVVWDGFDQDGRGVGAGVYFLKVRGGGAETTTRIVVLR